MKGTSGVIANPSARDVAILGGEAINRRLFTETLNYFSQSETKNHLSQHAFFSTSQ